MGIEENLRGFQDSLTQEQKKAILYTLFLIANSDKEFSKKEIQYFEITAKTIGFEITDTFIDECQFFNRTELNSVLNTLNFGQKDWYIVSACDMIMVDGKGFEIKSKYANVIFNYMGISDERIENTLKKAAATSIIFNANETGPVINRESIYDDNEIVDNLDDVLPHTNIETNVKKSCDLAYESIYSTGRGSGLKHCLKFFEDGTVIFSINCYTISSKSDINKINEWFNYESPSRGRFKVNGNKIDFNITWISNKLPYRFHYYGKILKNDGLILKRTEGNMPEQIEFVFLLMDTRVS